MRSSTQRLALTSQRGASSSDRLRRDRARRRRLSRAVSRRHATGIAHTTLDSDQCARGVARAGQVGRKHRAIVSKRHIRRYGQYNFMALFTCDKESFFSEYNSSQSQCSPVVPFPAFHTANKAVLRVPVDRKFLPEYCQRAIEHLTYFLTQRPSFLRSMAGTGTRTVPVGLMRVDEPPTEAPLAGASPCLNGMLPVASQPRGVGQTGNLLTLT